MTATLRDAAEARRCRRRLGTDEMMRPPADRPTKNMNRGDVEAPRVKVAHAGLHHAAGKLHAPQHDAGDHHRGRDADGGVQPLAAPCGGFGSPTASRAFLSGP